MNDLKNLDRREAKKVMEHHNPLLNINPGKKFITFGEVMMRLTPPNYDKIRVATTFEISYGGSEANIALALANLKIDSTFFSVVRTIPWERARCVCCEAMTCTAYR